MRILYLGAYNPRYDRNKILRTGLIANGFTVVECRISPEIKIWKRNALLWSKFRRIKNKEFDAIILAVLNQEVVYLGKLISKLCRAPLISDIFFSKYDSVFFDRQTLSKYSLKARFLYLNDKNTLKLSDTVIADTLTHGRYYSDSFNINPRKIETVYVGAGEEFKPYKRLGKDDNKIRVLFWGTYIPLHGIDYIVKAARLLKEDKRLEFILIGNGQTLPRIKRLVDEFKLNNIKFVDRQPLEKLISYIASADICLGIFGTTPKAQRVIPNKIFQALAMQKPIITMDSPAIRELFEDKEQMLFCKCGCGQGLAEKIVWAAENQGIMEKISKNGYNYFLENLTVEKIGSTLKQVIEETIESYRCKRKK